MSETQAETQPETQSETQVVVNDPTKYVGVPTADHANQALDAFKATGSYVYTSPDFSTGKPIPENFIQVACCAFRFDNLEMPGCIGMQSNCQVCCFAWTSTACKIIENHRVKAVCSDGTCEIINFTPTLKCYRQCFCIEVVMGLPSIEGAYVQFPPVLPDGINFTDAPAEHLIPYASSCCSVDSCFCKLPECVGYYSRGMCIFYESEGTGCKPLFCDQSRAKKDVLCLWQKGYCMIVQPELKIKSEGQMCCRDTRCALPCDKDVPCMFMPVPFLMAVVNMKLFINCCGTLKQVHDFANSNPMPIQTSV